MQTNILLPVVAPNKEEKFFVKYGHLVRFGGGQRLYCLNNPLIFASAIELLNRFRCNQPPEMKNVIPYHVNGLLSIEEVIEVYLVLGWPLKMHQDVVFNKMDTPPKRPS